ncbi:Gamma-glutamylputrescine oxidoreductase [Roseovarius sp. THAF27]|uniref:NAD(P)/FAD-dependent oxidoreductase n=1 Tax=Roseovarius sp. THAF27 TaxID=2587850 RepID=UPI0012A94CB2|nr:FAD-binding oxidoreductase [Roseovarius sp. THAF27]QFT82941.1 Gamma-glutamylputrescine oxidoreductase [Roseovarius sp. THAF27]
MTMLKRIWEEGAYGAAPVADCWWADTVPPGDWPALEGDTTNDVAIIGAGFTGLNAALGLAEAGVDVTVLEAQHPFWGASGRNGGFCCLGGAKASHAEIKAKFGETEARGFARAEMAAVDHVGGLIERLGLDVDRHSEGETQLAHRPRDFEAMRAEVGATQDLYGVTPTLTPREELVQAGFKGPFHGASTIPIGFALNPRKYALGLCQAAEAAGAVVHGQSTVTRIESLADGRYRLHTETGSVTAEKFIIATNGYSADNLPDWMGARYLPTQSSVIVTRPMSDEELAAQGWTSRQMCYDTRHLLHYFRLMPDNRMLMGMRGGLRHSPGTEAQIRAMIRADFEKMFPAWAHVETPHYWSGFVCVTRDLVPYAGPIPELPGGFAAFGYHGNGVSMGSYAGRLLADLVRGETPDMPYPAPLSHKPRKFPLGRFRRMLMRPAYLHYAWLDG